MPARDHAQKVFGAACLRLMLEKTVGAEAAAEHEIYQGALRDLSVTHEEVDALLARDRASVLEALGKTRRSSDTQ